MSDQDLDNAMIRYFSDAQLRPARLEEILQETVELQKASRADATAYLADESHAQNAVVGKSRDRTGQRFVAWLNRLGYPRALVFAIPSLVAVALVVGLLLQLQKNDIEVAERKEPAAPLTLAELVLKEAALNHRSKFKFDVVASDVESLVKGMSRLDFSVDLPATLASGFELIGGRYCTLGGHLAAHMRLKEHAPTVLYDKVDGHTPFSIESAAFNDLEQNHNDQPISLFQPRSRSLFVTRTGPDFNTEEALTLRIHDDVSVKSWKQGGLLYVLAEGDIPDARIQ